MEGSHCQVCDELFPNADELKCHQEGPCSPAADENTGNEDSLNPVEVLTPTDPSSLEAATGSPTPVDANTPPLGNNRSPTGETNSTTKETVIESEDGEPDAVFTSTQEVLDYIAGNDLPGSASSEITETTTLDETESKSEAATEVETIIAGFCVDAPCDKVRDILRLYSPENSYEKQKAIFDSRSKKDDLVKTLEFLGESCSSWKDVKKKDCAHKLHYRIQNLMPEECGVCKETYVVKVTDPRLLSCSICGHEVHHKCYESLFEKNDEGLSVVETLKTMPGFHHLCPSCEDAIIPDENLSVASGNQIPPQNQPQPTQKQPQHHKQQLKIQKQQQLQQSQQQQPTQPPQLSQQQRQPQPQTQPQQTQLQPAQQPQQQKLQAPQEQPSPNANVNEDSTSFDSQEEVASEATISKTQICRHYKNNTCKFGISGKGCPFVHPKRCSKLMNHGTRAGKGCNKGSKCEDFHPKMCPMSISKSECLDMSCTLCHVKGTRRKLPQRDTKPEKDVSKAESEGSPVKKASTKSDSKVEHSTPSLTTDNQSFLDQINLLKKELQEAIDKKLESLIQLQSQQTTQQMPPLPFHQFPVTQPMFAPIPWMHQYHQMQRNPMFPMGY